MPTVTQSYGNITIDKEYPVFGVGEGCLFKMTPMPISTYLEGTGKVLQDTSFPDFIVTTKEDAVTIQGMFTVLDTPVCVVPLLKDPIPTEGDDVGAVILVTVDIPHPELIDLIDRIPPLENGYEINTAYILIHDGD